MLIFLILLLIGIFGGILAGMLGVGGGLIFTPVLIFLFTDSLEDPLPWIIGTSLLCTFAASLSSVRKHVRMNNFFKKDSLRVGAFSLAGTAAGVAVVQSAWYSQTEFSILFSGLLFFTAYKFIFKKKTVIKPEDAAHDENLLRDGSLSTPQSLAIGTAGGTVATLAGVGGGVIMVPLMTMLLRQPYLKAISISSAAIVFISFFGWGQLALGSPEESGTTAYTLGYVDFGAALPLIAGALIGANYGVYATSRIPKTYMEFVFGLLALAVAARLLWRVFASI
ncbi:hypothetical protein CYPRO_2768 [Cyclonatronum proteinivorum]|uniref:Probable membrane transporter protein n=1 Tax=Cyclonatronum proteinivorum TaxID=1457365 RepID=A0A345UNF5_9BACT|nr:hypothetical protein CYPRO_2768 [Cyclonatronum proteinivorum]